MGNFLNDATFCHLGHYNFNGGDFFPNNLVTLDSSNFEKWKQVAAGPQQEAAESAATTSLNPALASIQYRTWGSVLQIFLALIYGPVPR